MDSGTARKLSSGEPSWFAAPSGIVERRLAIRVASNHKLGEWYLELGREIPQANRHIRAIPMAQSAVKVGLSIHVPEARPKPLGAS